MYAEIRRIEHAWLRAVYAAACVLNVCCGHHLVITSSSSRSLAQNKNWRDRIIILRKDRLEWHRAKPNNITPPAGVMKITSETVIEKAPQFSPTAIRVFDAESKIELFLDTRNEKHVSIAEMEEKITAAIAAAPLSARGAPAGETVETAIPLR